MSRYLLPTASVVVFNTSDASRIPRRLPTPPSSFLSPSACLDLPTPPFSSPIPLACKQTGASAVRDIHSDVWYILLPQLTHPLLLSRPWAACKHTRASVVRDFNSDTLYFLISQLTPPLLSSIPQAHLPLQIPSLFVANS